MTKESLKISLNCNKIFLTTSDEDINISSRIDYIIYAIDNDFIDHSLITQDLMNNLFNAISHSGSDRLSEVNNAFDMIFSINTAREPLTETPSLGLNSSLITNYQNNNVETTGIDPELISKIASISI
jgi:hypothetical protein